MLEAAHASQLQFSRTELEPDFSRLIANFVSLVRRRRILLLGCVLLALLIAAVYLLAIRSTYTATAAIMVVDPQMDPLRQAAAQRSNGGPTPDSGMVDTQVEILRSDTIARSVIRSLKLRKEPQLAGPLAWAQSLLAVETSPERTEQNMLAQFRNRSNIRRVGITNVIEVSYRSDSPSRAAQIANAIVSSYFDDQRNAKVQAGQAASNWLKEQISELSKQTISVSSILGDGKPLSSSVNEAGIGDQQLAELTKAREAARAETIQARAALQIQSDKAPSPEAQSRYEAARANEAALEAKLNNLIQGSLDASRERAVVGTVEADALRSAYNGLLQRLMAIRYEAFPGVDARVISSASEAVSRSYPRTAFVLAGALAVGLVFGFSGALIRDGLDRTARSGLQLESTLHLPFLGSLPILRANRGAWAWRKPNERVVTSRYMETLRNVRFEMGLVAPPATVRVIGFTSARDREGRTTAASNFASLLKESGHQVALVVADLRSRSHPDGSSADIGLWQVLVDRCPLHKAISRDKRGVPLLSAGRSLSVPAAADLLSSAKMQNTLQLLEEQHDVIVIDLPPLSRLVDLKAISPWIDSLVLIVEYGRTDLEEVRVAPEIEVLRGKWAGVLLNNAPGDWWS